MYSEEIKNLLEFKQNLIDIYEYCEIIKTSPQIDHVLYKDEYFNLFTTDNYHFKLKIKEVRRKS